MAIERYTGVHEAKQTKAKRSDVLQNERQNIVHGCLHGEWKCVVESAAMVETWCAIKHNSKTVAGK